MNQIDEWKLDRNHHLDEIDQIQVIQSKQYDKLF